MGNEKEKQHEDEALDAALEATFPASDPIAVTPRPRAPDAETEAGKPPLKPEKPGRR